MRLLVAGDFSPMNRVNRLMKQGDYPPHSLLQFKQETDLFILNFETSVANEGFSKIKKVGPHLCCTEKVAPFLKEAGVTAVTLANNHTMDYGAEGLSLTMNLLKNNGIEIVGAGHNQEDANRILYLRQGKESVAIINCCEHEFSYAEANKAGTNALNPIKQYYSIKEAKNNADYVVVIVHGGHEFFNLPSQRMVETYHFFVDAGAEAVINHHQHCYSGFEYYKGKPIYYGLGNLCFDWPNKKPSFYIGYCVRLHMGKTVSSEELPYIQCKERPTIDYVEPKGFRDDLERLNLIIQNPEQLQKENLAYYRKMGKDCKGVVTPFSNRYLNALVRGGFLPTMITQKKKMLWKAYIDCESHRDVMLSFLKDQT